MRINSLKVWMHRGLLAAVAAAFTFGSLPSGAQGAPTPPQQAPELAIGVCGTCHGVDGNSINPMFPRLAGQHAWYIEQQLKEFRDHTRGDPYAVAYMYGMANDLSNATIVALAKYFSHQTPGPGTPHPAAVIDRGRNIYEHGIPSQGVPACAACHGPQALGSSQFPRLAGQHAEYIMKQLQSFQNNMRNVAIMHGVAQTLHRSQMRAVADYLESLP
ncbi:MAG: c-type cytochrome [Steroidobacteraceae bacterium]